MKKIITAALIVVAATTSIFAGNPPAKPVYCECVGVGQKPPPNIPIPVKPTPVTLKEDKSISPFGKWFYELELIWLTNTGTK